jgi:hypothetical protein
MIYRMIFDVFNKYIISKCRYYIYLCIDKAYPRNNEYMNTHLYDALSGTQHLHLET